jgi:WD40 repeat protein
MYLLLFILSLFLPLMSAQKPAHENSIKKEAKQNVLDIVTPLPALQKLIHGYLEGSLTQIVSIPNQVAANIAFAPHAPYLVRMLLKQPGQLDPQIQQALQQRGIFTPLLPTIELYNLENHERKIITQQFANASKGIAFSPDGKYLAVGFNNGYNCNFELWETQNWTQHKTLLGLHPIENLRYSPNGAYIATAGPDGCHILDTKTWKLMRTLRTEKNIIAFSPDSSLVAFGSNFSDTVDIIKMPVNDLSLISITIENSSRQNYIRDINFTNDNKSVIIRSSQHITMWDCSTGKLLHTFPHKSIRDCALHPTEPLLVALEHSNKLHFWDLNSGQFIKSIDLDIQSKLLTSINFSPDGHYMIIRSMNGTHIRGYNNNAKSDITYTTDSSSYVSPNGHYCALLSPFRVIKIDLPHPITLDSLKTPNE